MTFLGFLTLFDPPKPNIIDTIASLKKLGVSLKIITGDNHLVAASLSNKMGLSGNKIITGPELRMMSDGALLRSVDSVDVFAEIEPNQKERIIIAMKKAGNVVGYMGDGINDASALHAADVGISVDTAADVAKDAADIVLLEKDLGVLIEGVRQGRTTFANTLNYGNQRKFWEYVQYGRIISLYSFSPLTSQTDTSHQPDDRLPRNDHCH
jgi:Mg2+-importing ATPase